MIKRILFSTMIVVGLILAVMWFVQSNVDEVGDDRKSEVKPITLDQPVQKQSNTTQVKSTEKTNSPKIVRAPDLSAGKKSIQVPPMPFEPPPLPDALPAMPATIPAVPDALPPMPLTPPPLP